MILLMGLIGVILLLLFNYLFKQTEWYKKQSEDAIKFKNILTNLQTVNLGSNNGKYSLDYTNIGCNGMNWAVGPQAICFDYKILKTFIHKIKKGGSLIIVISPFHSILDKFVDKNANDKYYLFLPKELIPDYSKLRHLKARINHHFPLFFLIRNPRLIFHIIRKNKATYNLTYNPMNQSQLIADANKWMQGWKKQFNIKNLEASLPANVLKIQKDNRKVLTDIIELCRAHQLQPLIVLPPITQYLLKHLTTNLRQMYIYNFLDEVIQKTGIKLLDYMDDERFSNPDLYFNSFFLNQRGRREFTQIVLKDIHSSIN